MPLYLAPVQAEDFEVIASHADIYEPGDDLVAPPYPIAWPVSTREEAQKRLRFAMFKQQRRFLEDSSARFMKVVDAHSEDQIQAGKIVSIARWHYYPSGYDLDSMIHWEKAERVPGEDWPSGLNRKLHDFILMNRDRLRKTWIGEGSPVWILMHLVTRQSYRGRGAAGLLIKWGVDQSERIDVPAYLEAGSQGRPIYSKHGFRQVGELRKFDLRPFGVEQTFELANMVRYPELTSSSVN